MLNYKIFNNRPIKPVVNDDLLICRVVAQWYTHPLLMYGCHDSDLPGVL